MQDRHLSVQLGLGQLTVGVAELALDQLDRRGGIAAGRERFTQARRGHDVRRPRVERVLVALDRAVTIAAALEQLGGTDPLVGACPSGECAWFASASIADSAASESPARLTEPRQRFERVAVFRIDGSTLAS